MEISSFNFVFVSSMEISSINIFSVFFLFIMRLYSYSPSSNYSTSYLPPVPALKFFFFQRTFLTRALRLVKFFFTLRIFSRVVFFVISVCPFFSSVGRHVTGMCTYTCLHTILSICFSIIIDTFFLISFRINIWRFLSSEDVANIGVNI